MRRFLLLLAPLMIATDCDGDGYDSSIDCQDKNPLIHPGAVETCDSVDEDCDGEIDEGTFHGGGPNTVRLYEDLDLDGYGAETSEPLYGCAGAAGYGEGYVLTGGDCCDAPRTPEVVTLAELTYPGGAAMEPTRCAVDLDDDGWGNDLSDDAVAAELRALGCAAVEAGSDCDDDDDARHPSAEEVCSPEAPGPALGVDEDCDGAVDEDVTVTGWEDSDGDGYGAGEASAPSHASCGESLPEGIVSEPGDCDDTQAQIYPGSPELCELAFGQDINCDGNIDENGCSGSCEEVLSTGGADGTHVLYLDHPDYTHLQVECRQGLTILTDETLDALNVRFRLTMPPLDADYDLAYNDASGDGIEMVTVRDFTNNGDAMCVIAYVQLPWYVWAIDGTWTAEAVDGSGACDDNSLDQDGYTAAWSPNLQDLGRGQLRWGVGPALGTTPGEEDIALKHGGEWGQDFGQRAWTIKETVVDPKQDQFADYLLWEYCDDGLRDEEAIRISGLDIGLRVYR